MTPSAGASRLLDVAVDVVETDGLSGLTVRSVATRAEVSPAQVQYYFRTKADLVAGAFERAGERFLESVAPVLGTPPSLERLRAVLELWLPLDAARTRRARAWLAFAEAAATDPALGESARQVDAEVREWLTEQVAELRSLGSVRADTDAAAAAAALFALVDGITVQALVVPPRRRAEFARPVLDAQVASLAG